MKLNKALLSISFCIAYMTSFASMQSELVSLSPKIANWSGQAAIQNELDQANIKHAKLTKSQIRSLNQQWKQEINHPNKPTISKIMNNGLSSLLQQVEEQSNGLYLGILITDQYGLNVGQTYVSPNYDQSHQSIWKKGFAASVAKPYIYLGNNKKAKSSPPVIAMPILDSNGKKAGLIEVNINKAKLGS